MKQGKIIKIIEDNIKTISYERVGRNTLCKIEFIPIVIIRKLCLNKKNIELIFEICGTDIISNIWVVGMDKKKNSNPVFNSIIMHGTAILSSNDEYDCNIGKSVAYLKTLRNINSYIKRILVEISNILYERSLDTGSVAADIACYNRTIKKTLLKY